MNSLKPARFNQISGNLSFFTILWKRITFTQQWQLKLFAERLDELDKRKLIENFNLKFIDQTDESG